MAKQTKVMRKPLGEGLRRTPKELDRLSQITPDDIEAAKALVDSSSQLLGLMLDAQLMDDIDGDQAQPD